MHDIFDIEKLSFDEKYARTRVLFAMDIQALGIGVSVKLRLPAVHAAFASDGPNARTFKDWHKTSPLPVLDEEGKHYAN